MSSHTDITQKMQQGMMSIKNTQPLEISPEDAQEAREAMQKAIQGIQELLNGIAIKDGEGHAINDRYRGELNGALTYYQADLESADKELEKGQLNINKRCESFNKLCTKYHEFETKSQQASNVFSKVGNKVKAIALNVFKTIFFQVAKYSSAPIPKLDRTGQLAPSNIWSMRYTDALNSAHKARQTQITHRACKSEIAQNPSLGRLNLSVADVKKLAKTENRKQLNLVQKEVSRIGYQNSNLTLTKTQAILGAAHAHEQCKDGSDNNSKKFTQMLTHVIREMNVISCTAKNDLDLLVLQQKMVEKTIKSIQNSSMDRSFREFADSHIKNAFEVNSDVLQQIRDNPALKGVVSRQAQEFLDNSKAVGTQQQVTRR